MRIWRFSLIFLVVLTFTAGTGLLFLTSFAPPSSTTISQTFIIPQDIKGYDLTQSLLEAGLIRSPSSFNFLKSTFYSALKIQPGGYLLTPNLWPWQVLQKISHRPDLLWFSISGCPRKEQIGEKLASTFGWSSDQLNQWNHLYTDTDSEYFEGVYYPDTYLIPVSETVPQIAQRFIGTFDEKFAPLAEDFYKSNIRWTTGVKIASLIAREAAGSPDMHLISGIIWNRLDKKMRLQIDATMQYTLGKNPQGLWWGTIDTSQKLNDSPYNTYLYSGLPPTPICSPNIAYIEAALNPETTSCLYYLHDSNQQIHCADTYSEHLKNIKAYLLK